VIEDVVVDCPYCGEPFGTLVDGSGAVHEGDLESRYFEDCAVCCRPILFVCTFTPDGTLAAFDARTDDDA
jgi:hypothetical protein